MPKTRPEDSGFRDDGWEEGLCQTPTLEIDSKHLHLVILGLDPRIHAVTLTKERGAPGPNIAEHNSPILVVTQEPSPLPPDQLRKQAGVDTAAGQHRDHRLVSNIPAPAQQRRKCRGTGRLYHEL